MLNGSTCVNTKFHFFTFFLVGGLITDKYRATHLPLDSKKGEREKRRWKEEKRKLRKEDKTEGKRKAGSNCGDFTDGKRKRRRKETKATNIV